MQTNRIRCFKSLHIMLLVSVMATPQLYGAAPAANPDPPSGAEPAPRDMVVAVREVPPFAMRNQAGDWEGLSVDLWQEVAAALGLTFSWREAPLNETVQLLRRGDVDVAVAAISVTGPREAFLDFSHPYYVTGLSPAFRADRGNAWLATLRNFFSLEFLWAVGSLAVVLLVAGFAVWLFERKANAEQFGHGGIGRGLGDGFWWSAVTMTTVGYGDKAPQTLGGRIVALIWMFVSLIIIASFTASIAASLTTNELSESLVKERPISELRVGVLGASAAEEYARNQGAVVQAFEALPGALGALEAGRVDTVIHDAPILTHEVRRSQRELLVADTILVRDDYAFAYPEGSPQRNRINIALLSVLSEPSWRTIRARYLGDQGP